MIISQFEAWAKTAAAPSRADGVSALARAFLYSNLDPDQRADAIRALTAFLDDPSVLVRRALADAVASAAAAPHHIVLALAADQPGIAGIVLSRSPILSDAELIDCAYDAGEEGQIAIASRHVLSSITASALAEIAEPAALVALAANHGADLTDAAITRMVERHGSHAELREALLARGDLPVCVRVDLVAATASALAAFVTGRNWVSDERTKRITREAAEKATIAIAGMEEFNARDDLDLASHLRRTGQLTVAFAMRTILSGNLGLATAVFADLTGMALGRVDGLTRRPESAGFAALYRKAGFPIALLPAFRLALAAARDETASGLGLSRALVVRVIDGCVAVDDGRFDKLLVLLRRFEIEAAREEARGGAGLRTGTTNAPSADVTVLEALERQEPPRDRPIDFAFDEAVPRERAVPVAGSDRPPFTIDLAAIEAELLAA